MINELVDRYYKKKDELKQQFKDNLPDEYEEIFKKLIETITGDEYDDYCPDPNRITKIDHGDYQGTLLFVVAEKGYQPHKFYFTTVSYGSCSACDTLQSVLDDCEYDDDFNKVITDKAVDGIMTLALHMLQRMKVINEDY